MKRHFPALCLLTAFSIYACDDSPNSTPPENECIPGDESCENNGENNENNNENNENNNENNENNNENNDNNDEDNENNDEDDIECETRCSVDEKSCDGINRIRCAASDDKCGQWVVEETCTSGTHCDEETWTCEPGCLETCDAESPSQCSEDGVLTCTSDSAGCAVWNLTQSCSENEICNPESLECVSCIPECASDKKCTETGIATCSIDESGCAIWTETPCQGTDKCDLDTLECASSCIDACKAGEKKCSDNGVLTCGNYDDDECLEWSAPEPCSTGQRCLESTKQCGFACGDDCEPFSIVFLPDTQNYADSSYGTANPFYQQIQWINKKQAERNIKFVLHLGDFTNDNKASQWEVSKNAMNDLKIPFLVSTGNHDYLGETRDGMYRRDRTKFNQYFNKAFFDNKPWTVKFFNDANNNDANMYSTFQIGELKFLVMSLEHAARKDTLCKANEIIENHKDHYVIVTTHNILFRDGSNHAKRYTSDGKIPYTATGATGEQFDNELLKRHSNIILAASGHVSGSAFHDALGNNGNKYYEMLCDYQREQPKKSGGNIKNACGNETNAGNGWLRIITIDPTKTVNNALAETISAFEESANIKLSDIFYGNPGKAQLYCSKRNNDDASKQLYEDNPKANPVESYDKYSNAHNFTFSLDFSKPLKYACKMSSKGFGTREMNNDLTRSQKDPSVAVNPATGDFVTVWADNVSDKDGKDSAGHENYDIAARLFHAGGCSNGKSFIVNTNTNGAQNNPDVAMDENGNFVIVWEDDNDGNGATQLFMKGYDKAGKIRIKDTVVNKVDKGNQNNPAIAMNAKGDFVVAWEDDSEVSGKPQVFVRGFNANGTEKFAQFNVVGKAEGTRTDPDVAIAADGSFVVAWTDDGDGNGATQIHARMFNANGKPLKNYYPVNTVPDKDQQKPSVAIDSNGIIYFAYEDNSASTKSIIKLAAYNSKSSDTKAIYDKAIFKSKYAHTSPSICVDKNGKGVLTWSGGNDFEDKKTITEAKDVQKRTFNANGFVTNRVVVNEARYKTYDKEKDKTPVVACTANGQHVIVWREMLDLGKADEIYGRGFNSI